MKYILLFLVSISFTACSMKVLENSIENLFIASSGNKPPSFFKIANTQTMRDYVFDVKDATFSLPIAKEKDFTAMDGWKGSTHYNKDVVLYLDKGFGVSYHIQLSSFVYPYAEREKAVEYKDKSYIQTHMQYGKNKYGREGNINVHYETHGKEHYSCIVKESKDTVNGENAISYDCHKFNPERTMAKGVVISLTYTRVPNLPKELEALANEYTYEDLQTRSQRILDSLYIKDGWEK